MESRVLTSVSPLMGESNLPKLRSPCDSWLSFARFDKASMEENQEMRVPNVIEGQFITSLTQIWWAYIR